MKLLVILTNTFLHWQVSKAGLMSVELSHKKKTKATQTMNNNSFYLTYIFS